MAVASTFGRKINGGDRVMLGRKHSGTRSFGRKALAYGKKLAITGGQAALRAGGTAAGAYLGGPVGASVGYAIGNKIATDLN